MIVIPFVFGSLANNTFLLADPLSKQAAVIDPSFDPQPLLEEAERRGWAIEQIWLTHAHFDHIAGVETLRAALGESVKVALHSADYPLWNADGGAGLFGFPFRAGREPELFLSHGQVLRLGALSAHVRHTPGHAPGHVVFSLPEHRLVFTGDLIFFRSVGRTDLPGADGKELAASIRREIYPLPGETRLLPGHGPETTVSDEVRENPFV
jgi:glyoxylase-like metal-dependent hydrolase (beta-lactamase superfamily II)